MATFNVQFNLTVDHPPATFLPASGPFFSPLATGTVVGSVTGVGTLLVNAPFSVSGSNIVVGASPLATGPHPISGTMGGAPYSGNVTVSAPAVYTPRPGPFYSPLASGTIVGSVTGGLAPLTAVAPFAVSGANIIVGASPLSAGSYTVSGSAGGSTFTSGMNVSVPANFTAAPGPFFAPLASGTVVGSVTGAGTFTVNAPFAMSGSNIVVGASPLAAATYTISGAAGSSPYTGSITVQVAVTFVAATGPFYAPLATGTVIGSVTGNGTRVVSSPFAMSGANVVVGPTPLTAGSYTPTGTVGGIAFSGSLTVAVAPTAIFTPGAGPFYEPLASGTVIGAISGTATGTITVAAPFAVSGANITVGASPLAAGSYTVSGSRQGIAFSGSIAVAVPATYSPAAGPFFAPLASGTVVGSVTGVGTIVVASPFLVSGSNIVVGAAALAAGAYTITGTVGGSPYSASLTVAVAVAFTPAAGPFYAPLPTGTVVGSVTGTGTRLVDAPFAMSGANVVVGASPITEATYPVTGTVGGIAYSGSVTVQPALTATFTPAAGPFYSPVAAGTVVGSISGTATGTITVNSPFAVSGTNIVVGASPLSGGSYSITGSRGGVAFSGSLTVVVIFTAALGPFFAPLASGSIVGTVGGTATPITVNSPFAVSGRSIIVGATPLTAANYTITGTVGGVAFGGAITVSTAVPTTLLSAVITVTGQAPVTYTQSGATDMGDYVDNDPDGPFTQKCFRAPRQDAIPSFSVWFRPDSTSNRKEVVFELGDIIEPLRSFASVTKGNPTIITTSAPHKFFNGLNVKVENVLKTPSGGGGSACNGMGIVTVISPTSFSVPKDTSAETNTGAVGFVGAWNMPAYKAEIYNDGVLVWTQNLTLHYWWTRWRWQSTPRPVRKTPAQLVAAKLVAVYDPSQIGRFTTDFPAQPAYSPMGFSGLVTAMNSGGPRQDIGLVPGWSANWLANGSAVAKASMLTHGECSGTIQCIVRDTTGKPVDVLAFGGSTYPGGGSPYVCAAPGLINFDDGHHPALAYVPAISTGDPYFIEALQFIPSMIYLTKANNSFRWTGSGRYGAWGMRDVLNASKITPATVPSWMAPKSQFVAYLGKLRSVWVTDMANPAPERAVFHDRAYGKAGQGTNGYPTGAYAALWQTSMESMVAWYAVQLGFTEWLPQAQWISDSDINRMNGISGMPRAVPAPYDTPFSYCASVNAAMDAVQTTMDAGIYGKGTWPTPPFQVQVQSEKMWVTAHDTSTGIMSGITRGYGGSTAAIHPMKDSTGYPYILGPMMTSWAQLGAHLLSIPTYMLDRPTDPSDPSGLNVLNHDSNFMENTGKARAALAIAVRNGHTPAQDAYNWINGQFILWASPDWTSQWAWMQT